LELLCELFPAGGRVAAVPDQLFCLEELMLVAMASESMERGGGSSEFEDRRLPVR
jgi:hypothetical protein